MLTNIITEEQITQTKQLIDNARQITILTHISPDGDALGSSLGLWWFLKGIGKKAKIVVPNKFPEFLAWMPGSEEIVVALDDNELADKTVAEADTIFFLDFNTLSRINWLKNSAASSTARKVLIDHHPYPDIECDICISYPEISSTSELIFRLICRMGQQRDIDLKIAECIYTGMMTDTGNFSYNSQCPEIYLIIHELLKIGINKDDIYNRVFSTYSVDRMRLMGYCLSKKMKIYKEQRAALIYLTLAECEHYNYQIGDTEGFVNMPFSIKDIDISILARQDKEKIKISFRSQGSFPANKMAEEFKGGGHLNAAGGESYFSMKKTIDMIEEAIRNRKKYEQ